MDFLRFEISGDSPLIDAFVWYAVIAYQRVGYT